MGTRGPIGKRSNERRRRNKVPGETVIKMDGPVRAPRLSKDVHPIARRWYNSLKQSGQSLFFEPSDWAAAIYVTHALTKSLETAYGFDRKGGAFPLEFNGKLFGEIWAAMNDLLTTEAARRRVRMEIERGGEVGDSPGVAALDEYRKRLASKA